VPVARTGRAGGFQGARQKRRCRFPRGKRFSGNDRLQAVLSEIHRGPGAHAPANHGVTVFQHRQQARVAVWRVILTVPMFFPVTMARAMIMGGFRRGIAAMVMTGGVRANFRVRDLAIGYREHDKTGTAPEMFGQSFSVRGGNRDFHLRSFHLLCC